MLSMSAVFASRTAGRELELAKPGDQETFKKGEGGGGRQNAWTSPLVLDKGRD